MDQTTPMRKREVPAVARAIAILKLLADSGEPLGVNPVARELGLVPSTCLHILRVLHEDGFVTVDPETKRYTLGLGILPLARAALRRQTFATLVQPKLDELSSNFGVTAIATQLTGTTHMTVVALSQSTQPFRLQVDLGSRFPALISATGRCFAAFGGLNKATLRADFARLRWDNPPSYEDWLSEIEDVRRTGFAVDRGRYMSGVTVVAVPTFGRDQRMTRSIVAIGISQKLEAEEAALAKHMETARLEIENLSLETNP